MLAVLAKLLVESMGYAVAHSMGVFAISFAIAPGIGLMFFDIGTSENVLVALSSAITAGYYMLLYFGIRRLKR
ncbi:hypothetical protein ACQ86G_12620 [Roseateles chitinivorans]|uniref:hypothetical protein n=1 Tax=Roseateles chitinivorans TaxID=2917965 RepID=UPI003D677494